MIMKKEIKKRLDLPHNTEAEKAVLGAMLRSKTIFLDYIYRLSEDAFFEENENHRAIFKAMKSLHDKNLPADSQTVTNELINLGLLEVSGAPEYLIDLGDSIVSFENINSYLDIVLDQYLLRKYLTKINEITDNYYNKEITSVTDFLRDSEQQLSEIASKRKSSDFSSSKEITDVLSKEFETLKPTDDDSSCTGISTGFQRLNMYTHGFQKGQFVVIAARTGVGKTALSLNLAANVAMRGVPVAYFSLEMLGSELFKRLVSADSNVKFDSILTGFGINQNVRLKLQQSCKRLSETKIYVDDLSGIMLGDLVTKCRKLKATEPDLGIIFVDHIGLVNSGLTGKNDSRQLQVQHISTTLKKLALELQVTIVGVAQLNRNVEQRGGEPQLSDLRESGSIEQDADVVMMLHESKVGETNGQDKTKNVFEQQNAAVQQAQQEIAKKEGGPDVKILNIIIVKNRQGKVGRVPLLFRKDYCKFDSPSKASEEQIVQLESERVNYFNRD